MTQCSAINAADNFDRTDPRPEGSPIWRVRRLPLVGRISRNLRLRCRVQDSHPVIIGVSGGADSVALMLAMAAARSGRTKAGRTKDRCPPVIVHVNHQLRNEAAEEAQHVHLLAEACGLRCVTCHIDPAQQSGNLSQEARRLRYAALASVAREHGADTVLTAHHADDQLETMLMQLGRGTGLRGLAGMGWVRTLEPGIRLARPMLDCRRADAAALCRRAGVTWCDDPTNSDARRTRARIRTEVTPVIEALWPGAPTRIGGTASDVADLIELLDRAVETVFGPVQQRSWLRDDLKHVPRVVVAAGLRRALAQHTCGGNVSRETIGTAVDMILDEAVHPREVIWRDGVGMKVTIQRVELIESASC